MVLIATILIAIVEFALIGGALFISAGRTDIELFWAYLVIMLVPSIYTIVVVSGRQPDQFREQMRPGAGNRDRLSVPAAVVLALAHFVIAGLDVGRYHWSDSVPLFLQYIGFVGFGAGILLLAWAVIANRFFSSAVRVQTDRSQQVISDGPYHYVRHPAYSGEILLILFSGIALGSWLSVLPMLILAAAVIRRTRIEDKMLQNDLRGYAEYAQSVRYRLIPGLW